MKCDFLPFQKTRFDTMLVGVLVLALSACSQQSEPAKPKAAAPADAEAPKAAAPAEAAATGKRLILAIKGEPSQGFDPIKGWGRYGNPLFQSTLLKRNKDLELVGDLATKWELSEDGKVWTITIRDDAKFADGKPLTAEDVAFTYETGKAAAGVLDLTELESAKALDPTTVEITLKKPRVTFMHTFATLGIVPKHFYKDGYGEAPMGSGPFKFVNWSKGQQLVIEPNPHYYGKKPEFERITMLYTDEDATAAAAAANQVQVAVVTPSVAGNVPAHMERVVVDSVDNRGIMFPTQPATGKKTEDGLDVGNNVTSDIAIRKAINIAIDRSQLAKGVLGGYGTPAWGVADNLPWDNAEHRLSDADIESAKALLDKAGWVEKDGIRSKNGVEARFRLVYPSSDNVRQALAVAVADMIKPLGIVIEVAGKSWDEIKKREKHSNAILFGWGSHNPLEIYNLYHEKQAGIESYNAGFYKNATVSAHLDKAQTALSFEDSIPHWKKAQWDGATGLGMKGDAPWAWLVNLDHIYFVDKCLNIGPRQIEPHGHGYPITWNIQDWKWTCQ